MTLTSVEYHTLLDVRRREWDPGERPHPNAGMRPVEQITGVEVHWMGSPGELLDTGDTAGEVLAAERYHEDTKGWTDLFYNVALDADGQLFEGRDVTVQSQVSTRNWLTVLCVAGTAQTATPTQLERFATGIHRLWKAVDPGLDPGNLRTHRDRGGSQCPGTQLGAIVNSMRKGMTPTQAANASTTAPKIASVRKTKKRVQSGGMDLTNSAEAQQAKDRGLWNGDNGDQVATRSVAAVMANRAAEYRAEGQVTELDIDSIVRQVVDRLVIILKGSDK